MNRYSQVFIEPVGDVPAAEVYHSRREALLQKLDTIGLFCGISQNPGSEEVYAETWNKMVQDPSFLFLSGLNQPGCKLLLDPKADDAEHREVLFLPKKDANKEFWTGIKVAYAEESLAEVQKLTGFKTILPETEFWSYLNSRVQKQNLKTLEAFYLEFEGETGLMSVKDDHNAKFAAELRKRFDGRVQVKSLAQKHMDLRVILDDARIADSRRAQVWTNNAFGEFLKNLKNFKTEREAQLFLDYKMQVQSDGDLAFPTIMANGKNACCLHYVKNDEALEPGKLLLMDFGVRAGTQHSDISRTVPVNGKFNPLQKILYTIVLDAQKFHQKNVKPGAKLADLNPLVWDFIWNALQERFVSKGGTFKLLYEKRPHGVSHLIGEQIHEGDPFRCYMQKPLKPGMLISNEPGLYGYFEIDLDGIHYAEDVGIRIENDLLVTETGCEDISAEIPREIAELEKLLA